ncbi:MAG: hypothetical protein ABIP20_19495 [Chthoniobacteraceae bacterium]
MLAATAHPTPDPSQFFTVGFLLADHLSTLGCKRIVYVARTFRTDNARIAGARETLVRHSLGAS